jgi:hypothetical protein
MEGTDPQELRSESAEGGHAAPRLPALPLHAGLPSVLSDDNNGTQTLLDDSDLRDYDREGDHYHYHGVAAFQHDWRSNDALFFAHYNRVRDPGGDAREDRVRGRIVQSATGRRAVVSGRRAVLGLSHDGQPRLRDGDESEPLRVQGNGDSERRHVQPNIDDGSRSHDATVTELDDARRRHPAGRGTNRPRSDGFPDAS